MNKLEENKMNKWEYLQVYPDVEKGLALSFYLSHYDDYSIIVDGVTEVKQKFRRIKNIVNSFELEGLVMTLLYELGETGWELVETTDTPGVADNVKHVSSLRTRLFKRAIPQRIEWEYVDVCFEWWFDIDAHIVSVYSSNNSDTYKDIEKEEKYLIKSLGEQLGCANLFLNGMGESGWELTSTKAHIVEGISIFFGAKDETNLTFKRVRI